jgi:hypothetical protein
MELIIPEHQRSLVSSDVWLTWPIKAIELQQQQPQGIPMGTKFRTNGATKMSNIEQDLALAKSLLDRGEMDAAEELLDKVEAIQKAAQAADDAQDEEEDTLDETDDDEEDDGQDDNDDVSKAFRSGGITYPSSDDAFLASGHQNMGPVSADRLSPYPHGTGVTDVVQRPGRHPFDDAVDKVMARDGSSRNAAMVTARLENPRLYDDYQRARYECAGNVPELVNGSGQQVGIAEDAPDLSGQ